MTQNTAQGEAMQAVRLLRTHALQGELTQAQIETLYQASKLLEGFIENDLRAKIDAVMSDDEDMVNRFEKRYEQEDLDYWKLYVQQCVADIFQKAVSRRQIAK